MNSPLQLKLQNLSPEQLENVKRYQRDHRLADRLSCPVETCIEQYMPPGCMCDPPLTRRTILALHNDGLYCRPCKKIKQDWVWDYMAEYTEDVQSEVHAALKAKIEKECEKRHLQAVAKQNATLERLRSEMPKDVVEVRDERLSYWKFKFPSIPYLIVQADYDGATVIRYSNTNFKNSLGVKFFWKPDWEGNIMDHVHEWEEKLKSVPDYFDVPI